MRISTSMIYSLGTTSVQNHVNELYKIQGQISSGKRITTPSDDPLAAARVLEIGQSQSAAEQFQVNGTAATSALQAQEGTLQQISSILQDVRALAVQAGDASLTANDKLAVATELQGKYDYLLGLANTSENGKYLFSGFKGETQPFSETSPGVVAYNGDQGTRLIQVSPSRQVPVSASGVDLFQRIKNGNGDFEVLAASNKGTGVAGPGSVLNSTLWNAAGNTKDYKVVFAEDTSATPGPSVYTYDIVVNAAAGTTINGQFYANGVSLLTGVASNPTLSTTGIGGPLYPRTYTPGAAISFKKVAGDTNPNSWDLGIEMSVVGTPSSNPTTGTVITPDTFTVKGSANNQDIFATIHNLVAALKTKGGAPLSNTVMNTLANLTQAEDAVNTQTANVGVTLKEVESHAGANEDAVLQYKTTISKLEDVDIAEAATALALRQTNLEASQKSFLTVSSLSLFNYLRP